MKAHGLSGTAMQKYYIGHNNFFLEYLGLITTLYFADMRRPTVVTLFLMNEDI